MTQQPADRPSARRNISENLRSLSRWLERPGNVALPLAALLFFAAVIIALLPVKYDGVDCGSWAAQNNSAAELADANQNLTNSQNQLGSALLNDSDTYGGTASHSTYAADGCADARGNYTVGVAIFAILAIVALVVGVIRRYQPRSTATETGTNS